MPTLLGGRHRRHPPKPTGAGEPVQQLGQDQLGYISILGYWRREPLRPKAGRGVHYDVALASRHPFARVIASGPPFSVVFTDWLSMMAALGVASRPSLSRTTGRSASSTRSQVPSPRHFRKYHQIVPPRGQVVGHHSPRYAATQYVQYAVYDLPQVHGARVPPGCIWGQQRFQQAPLGVGQIAGIRFSIHIPKVALTRLSHQATHDPGLGHCHTPSKDENA